MDLKLNSYKKIGLFIFCIFFAGITIAQNSTTGIKLGYNSSKFIGNGITGANHENMPGLNIGGLYNKKLTKFDLQIELLLSTKGYQINSIGNTYISNLFIYLELPVLIRKDIYTTEKLATYVIGGPSIMIKVLCINLVSEIEGIKNFDSGVNLGLGLQYSKISFEVRFNQSFINFDQIEPSKYNQVISFGMNFYFKDKVK